MDILDFVEDTGSLLEVADTQDFVEGMDMDLVTLRDPILRLAAV